LLESSPQTPREAAKELARMTESEVVQVVGGSMVFFKVNEELRRKEREKKKEERKRKNNFKDNRKKVG